MGKLNNKSISELEILIQENNDKIVEHQLAIDIRENSLVIHTVKEGVYYTVAFISMALFIFIIGG